MRRHAIRLLILLPLAVAPLVVLPSQSASAATIGSCARQEAANPKGWYPSRYEWCKVEPLSAGERDKNKIGGTVNAIYDIAVTTEQKERRVHIDFQIKNIISWGTLEDTTLSVQIPCQGCVAGDERGRTARLSDWEKNPNTSFDFTGDLGSGRDRVASHAFHPRFVLGGRLTYDSEGTSFRCDQASYVTPKSSGCVFPQYVPKYTFGGPNSRIPEVDEHVSFALNHPAGTVPGWRGKTIPSRLHRLYDRKAQDKNRSVAVAACDKFFPNYRKITPKQSCDEFPFASTVEGAAKGDLRYSARSLNADQNSRAGALVNAFWVKNRVIDGDAFDVASTK